MCGIVGLVGNEPKLIKQLTQSLKHRGPDFQATTMVDQVSLGHARLKILDLSSYGNQPMSYKDLTIVFNGEIYNFTQLRRQLETKGHRFKTKTDTEVILHAYEQWGHKAVSKFQGMWALAIYSTKNKQLFLSRDRFGIKPLYYSLVAGKLQFASELKTLAQLGSFQLDYLSLNSYFFHRYIPQPASIYSQIKSLPPGSNASYDTKTQTFKTWSYYSLKREVARSRSLSLAERQDNLSQLLPSVVADHLIADVGVGIFLSGGIDSSLITALAIQTHPQIKTFSVSFNNSSYDESKYSQMVANNFGLSHESIRFDLSDELLETCLQTLDQPLADPSILPTLVLSQITKKQVSVALSGDGGDEVFGGYDTYRGSLWADQVPSELFYILKPLANLLPEGTTKVSPIFLLKRLVSRFHSDKVFRHMLATAIFPESSRLKLLQKHWMSDELLVNLIKQYDSDDLQHIDLAHYLPSNILIKTDLASMRYGLEVRVPLLDHRIVELALSLPRSLQYSLFSGKLWLKSYARPLLPTEIIDRPKRGFSVPLHQVLKESQLVRQFLLSHDAYEHQILDEKYVSGLYQQFLNRGDFTRELWSVFVFNYWWWRR